LTVDLHAPQITGFFDIPIDHLFAAPVFYNYLQKLDFTERVVFSPDVGGMKMAAAYADMFGCRMGMIAKRRLGAEHVEALSIIGEAEGRNVLLVDDMTESAGTLLAAAKLLKENGALTVRAAVSHGVLNETGYERLKATRLIDEIITTDSTPVDARGLAITVLSIAELLGEAILRIHNNQSISSLLTLL
jgi:ribose-phosphate pyrophosphokinase